MDDSGSDSAIGGHYAHALNRPLGALVQHYAMTLGNIEMAFFLQTFHTGGEGEDDK